MKKWLIGLVTGCIIIGCPTVNANNYTVNDIAFLMLLERENLKANRIISGTNNYIKNLPCWDDNGKYVNEYSSTQFRELTNQYGSRYDFVCMDKKTILQPKISYWLDNFRYPLSQNFKDDINDSQTEININNIRKILTDNENEEIRVIAKAIDVRYLLNEDYKTYKSEGGSFLGTLDYKSKQGGSEYYTLMISNIENYVNHNVPIQPI